MGVPAAECSRLITFVITQTAQPLGNWFRSLSDGAGIGSLGTLLNSRGGDDSPTIAMSAERMS